MISILFVDDEPNILEGLERMLRSMRHEWEMTFAQSGQEALAILAQKEVDVIISDMKMPSMDGSELLHAVTEKYPHIIRIVLSGYAEKEMIMKSVGTAHQYLSKPCDSEVLKATIARVCDLRNLLTDETLRRLVSQLPNVPSLPILYSELMDELATPEPSTRKIGEIVKQDIGMTVKMLQIVNSAFFGLRRQISDSREAVDFLGLDTISSLTLGLGVISQLGPHASGTFLDRVWNHSMAVGVLANKIAVSERSDAASDAFTAGLLHEIGRVVLAVNLPGEFQEVTNLITTDEVTAVDAESRVFGATSAEVGAFLLGLWGLPAQVVQAVAFHNRPQLGPKDHFSATTAVHVANALQNFMDEGRSGLASPDLDMQYLADLGLVARLPVWQAKCAAFAEAAMV